MTEQELLNIVDFKVFLRESGLSVANNAQWLLFCKRLEEQPLTELNEVEKLILVKAAFLAYQSTGFAYQQLEQLLKIAAQFKAMYGLAVYYAIFTAHFPRPQHKIYNYHRLHRLAEEFKLNDKFVETLVSLGETSPESPFDLETFLKAKEKECEQQFELRHPARSYLIVRSSLTEINADVHFPLNTSESNEVFFEFLELDGGYPYPPRKKDYVSYNFDLLVSTIKSFKGNKIVALVGLRELIRRHYGIFPYDTQMMAILGILKKPESLKGRIAQVKTGEGKSTIIAILAAFKALQGHFVDVVTSNAYLAERDCEKYRAFYASLGISCSALPKQSAEKKDFRGQIIYSTMEAIKFSVMGEGLYHEEIRYSLREGKLVARDLDQIIIDEIDTIVDTALNSARFSVPARQDVRWAYVSIFHFVKALPAGISISPKIIADLRKQLAELYEGRFVEQVEKFTDDLLITWIAGAKDALLMRENDLYAVRPKRILTREGYQDIQEIVPVDRDHTGRLNEDSRYSEGLHEFLEVKHGISPRTESNAAAAMSHSSLLSEYQGIYGLTGTMGGEVIREEVRAFGIDSFDVPPYRPCIRVNLGLNVLATKKEQFEAIYQVLIERTQTQNRALAFSSNLFSQDQTKPQQAALVLFNTIQQSIEFSQFLASKKLRHQLLHGYQQEKEEIIVERAGWPGMITVATNLAGRGTDIHGNIHVVFAANPHNDRVQMQGYGRAGRQGGPGSCESILSLEDPAILKLIPQPLLGIAFATKTKEEFQLLLEEQSNKRAALESTRRRHNGAVDIICYAKLKLFFIRLRNIQLNFDNNEVQNFLITQCASFPDGAVIPNITPSALSTVSDTNPVAQVIKLDENWRPLILQAHALLQQRGSAIAIDWKGFLIEYKKRFINEIQIVWGEFYSLLETCRHHELAVATQKIEASYAEFERVTAYLDISVLLHSILHHAQNISLKAGKTSAQTSTVLEKGLFRATNTQADSEPVSHPCQLILSKYKRTEETAEPNLEEGLRRAAAAGDEADVVTLLAAGAEVNAQDENPSSRRTALHWAVLHGHAKLVSCLLNQGAATDVEDALHTKPEEYAEVLGMDFSSLNANASMLSLD